MAIVPFITGLSSPGLAKLNKELHFGKLALFQAIQSFLNAAFTILIAYFLRSVWALVVATIFGEAVRSLGSFFVHPYRPGRNFDFKKAKELWGFGRWVLANQILHYLFNDGDDWVVGRVLSSQALGFYQMAYNIGNAPSTEVTSVFSQVAFPIFSRIQDDLVRLRLAYLRVMQVVMFLSTPVSVGIWLVAPDAVFLLMGEKWMPMVASLQILLIWGWIRSFRATIGPILLARGHPNHVALFTLVKVIVLALLILPFTLRWGIEGTSWAVVFSATIEIPLLFHSLRKDIQISYLELMQAIARPIWPALPMIILVVFCQKVWLVNADILPRLIISILMGGLVYLASFIWLDQRLGWNVRTDVQQAIISNLQPFLNLFKPTPRTQPP
jgi:O-antigen/teichoic acid export membrane protein